MLREQGRKALLSAIKPSFSNSQVVTSVPAGHQSTSHARSRRQPLLFHRPLPESKYNDVYRRSTKPLPRRPPAHLLARPTQIRPLVPETEICIDPANFPLPSRSTNVERPSQISPSAPEPEICIDSTNFAPPPPSGNAERSSHPPKDKRSPPVKLLKPYDLAKEVHQMCGRGDIDGAIRRLQNTPRDAQNTSVWNTMISHCVRVGKYHRSFEVFNDMKRRGFSPNVATYSTLLKGLTRVSDWSKHPKQLTRAHTLYEYYMKHIESVKYHEPENTTELSTAPLVSYLAILGEVEDRQKIFDVFFAMDSDGPFVPDKFLFCAMFDAIARCQEVAPTSSEASSLPNPSKSDAKYVWLQVEKFAQKLPNFELDSHVIAAGIRALTRGRSSDQTLALDITTKYLGLALLGERKPLRLSRFLTPWSLDAALTLCNTMQQYPLCVYFMRQVVEGLDLEKRQMRIIDRGHIQKLLRAHAALARRGSRNESLPALEALEWSLENDTVYDIPKLQPNHQTYHLLFMTCWRNADWARAMRAFELMTGVQATSFPESNEGQQPPTTLTRSAKKNIPSDLATMSFILRTALATKEVVHYRQAMWLADYVNLGAMLEKKADIFYRTRVAQSLLPIIARLEGELPAETFRKWKHLRIQAEKALRDNEETSVRDRRSLGSSWSFEEADDDAKTTRRSSGQDT